MIAALYVHADGVYAGLADDLWPIERDARRYDGPWPVVAHPPCETWCQLAPLVRYNIGREIGDDGGTFAAALAAVRRFGGVLEHPAYSYAWSRFGLPVPIRGAWTQSFDDAGWTTEVSQCAYGHPARKRTWLYVVGPEPPPVDWTEPPATRCIGGNYSGRGRVRGVLANATPPAFARLLVGLAASTPDGLDGGQATTDRLGGWTERLGGSTPPTPQAPSIPDEPNPSLAAEACDPNSQHQVNAVASIPDAPDQVEQ